MHHKCTGCNFCESFEPEHDYIKETRVRAERLLVAQHSPRLTTLKETHEQIAQLKKDLINENKNNNVINALDDDCEKTNWEDCNQMYCQVHTLNKLDDWHKKQQLKGQFRGRSDCTKEHFLDCETRYCRWHNADKHRFREIKRKLQQRNFNLKTHEDKGYRNKTLIKKYHRIIQEKNHSKKCKWCTKYQGKPEHPDIVTIDSIKGPANQKFILMGELYGKPVKIYVDSGADRELIAEHLVAELQLPQRLKEKTLRVSSIINRNNEFKITTETDHLPVLIAGRTIDIQFSIIAFKDCDIIIGNKFLSERNPLINWKTRQLLWENEVPSEL